MKYPRLRIGKPILLQWKISTGGEALPLEGRKLSFFLVNEVGVRLPMNFTSDKNILIAYFYGPDQKSLGKYGVELWEDKGLPTQNVVDQRVGFELVAHTDEEEIIRDDTLQATTQIVLSTSLLDVIGKSGGIDLEEIPHANSKVWGLVKPVDKTPKMTLEVGVDGNGKLWVASELDDPDIDPQLEILGGGRAAMPGDAETLGGGRANL